MKALKEEEAEREAANYYASDLDTDDEETTQLLIQAEKIKEKEDMIRMESRFRRVEKPKMSRRIARKRERTMTRLENDLGALGVDVASKRMRNFEMEQDREQTGRKIHVGRSPSLPAYHSVPRDIAGIPNEKVFYGCFRW